MSRDYTWEKVHAAVVGLATSIGSLQERLGDAFVGSLMHVEPDDLPASLRQDFARLDEALTRHEAEGDEGSVMASVARMSEEEARQLIESVVSMHDTLAKYGPSAGPEPDDPKAPRRRSRQ